MPDGDFENDPNVEAADLTTLSIKRVPRELWIKFKVICIRKHIPAKAGFLEALNTYVDVNKELLDDGNNGC